MSKTVTQGVFPKLVDANAFIDTLKLSIWGKRRDSPLCDVTDVGKKPIASRRGKYGWVELGIIEATGNRYEIVYGPLRLQKILPPLELILRSDQSAITAENAVEAINALVEVFGCSRFTRSAGVHSSAFGCCDRGPHF